MFKTSLACWSIVGLVACGGKVRFEGSGSGASGQGAGSSGSICEPYCAALEGCPEIPADCLSFCEDARESVPEGCSEPFDDLLFCLADAPDVCALDGTTCLAENFELASCIGLGTGGGFSDDGPDGAGFGGFSP